MNYSFSQMIYSAFITLFLLCFIVYLPVSASEIHHLAPDNSDMVYSENELMSWFAKHPDGGEVTLGCNISTGRYLSLQTSAPVTIYMNGYGIQVLSPTNISGPVSLVSINNPVPVFAIAPYASLTFTKDVRIDVVNSCGLYFENNAISDLSNDSSSSFSGSFFSMSVSGSRGIGIKCNGDLSLHSFNIRLEEGACGIEVLGNTSLFLTGIIGNGIPLRTAGEVSLDCCGISDVPANASVINRTESLSDTSTNYVISPSTPDELLSLLPPLLRFTFQSDAPSVQERISLLPVTWNIENVDTKTPGIYKLTTYPEVFPILGLDLDFPQITSSVLITDPGKFYLYSASSSNENVSLFFYETPAYDSSIELYYSADAGSTWQPFENFSFLYPSKLYLETPLDKNSSYLFQADITEDGITTRTNILKVEYDPDGHVTPQITDGDRDGSDRDDQPMPPSDTEIEPPPDTKIEPPSEPSSSSDTLPSSSPGDNNNSPKESETTALDVEKPPSTNPPSIEEKVTDSPKDTSSSKTPDSPHGSISENNNQPEITENEDTYSENRSDDAYKNQQDNAEPESAKNTIIEPMPVGKSGQVLPKLLLLCSVVMLVCLTLYHRGK